MHVAYLTAYTVSKSQQAALPERSVQYFAYATVFLAPSLAHKAISCLELMSDCDGMCYKVGTQREVPFGSCLQRSESTIAWCYCCGLMGKQSIAVRRPRGVACSSHGIQEAGGQRQGSLPENTPSDLPPPIHTLHHRFLSLSSNVMVIEHYPISMCSMAITILKREWL